MNPVGRGKTERGGGRGARIFTTIIMVALRSAAGLRRHYALEGYSSHLTCTYYPAAPRWVAANVRHGKYHWSQLTNLEGILRLPRFTRMQG